MFFTFTKRKLELELIENNSEVRNSIKKFTPEIANQYILINAILSIAFYFSYVLDSTTIEKAGSQYLYLTVIPFVLIIFRLLLLINTTKIKDDPIHYIENDKPLKWIFILYIFVLIFTLVVLK